MTEWNSPRYARFVSDEGLLYRTRSLHNLTFKEREVKASMGQTILGISGSLREGSNSTAILRTLAERDWGENQLVAHDISEVPLYNADLDGEEKPPAVVALKEAVAAADGLLLVSPEYNYGTSGVLKNALDWASRPGYQSVLKGKPVVIITSSPGALGGVRAQEQLRKTLHGTLSVLVPNPEVAIAGVADKLVDGKLVDETALRYAVGAVQALLDWPKVTEGS